MDSNSQNKAYHGDGDKNALMIFLVVDSTFGFLNVDALKTCRLVCTLWKDICSTHLRKRSRIVFQLSESNSKTYETYMQHFKETFPKFCNPFTSMKIKLQGVIPISPVLDILKEMKNSVTDLEIRNVTLCDETGENLANYDVTDILPDKVENLCIINNLFGGTNFTIAWKKIASSSSQIQTLDLYRCTVLVAKEISKANVQIVTLDHVAFTDNILLTDLINIPTVKKLSFKDISDKVHLHIWPDNVTVDLCHANISNSDWIVNEMSIGRSCILKIKELSARSSFLDLTILPSTIETLDLGPNTEIECREPIYLDSLKRLSLTGHMTSLLHFSNCPNLVSLRLSPDYDYNRPCSYNLGDFPTNVKRVKICQDYHSKIQWNGEFGHQLEMLIVSDCQWTRLNEILIPKFKPSHLIVNLNGICVSSDYIVTLVKNPNMQTVVIGPIYWKEDEEPTCKQLYRFSEWFENATLSSIVNVKSQYYLFTKGQGIAIEHSSFYSSLKL